MSETTPATLADLEAMRRDVREHKERAHRKMLLLYLTLILGIVLFLAVQTNAIKDAEKQNRQFQKDIVANCETVNRNTENINALIDTFIVRVQQADELTQAQKDEFVKLYTSAKGTISECPPSP